MAKTPYEIRMDLLSLSKDLLEAQYKAADTVAWSFLENLKAAGALTPLQYLSKMEEILPNAYTPEQIIAQAEKLQKFVNNKD
jgi:hypothetical protein